MNVLGSVIAQTQSTQPQPNPMNYLFFAFLGANFHRIPDAPLRLFQRIPSEHDDFQVERVGP